MRAIAVELGRAPSTISREIRRDANRTGVYRPHAADGLAKARRRRPKTGKIEGNWRLKAFVQEHLDKHWSPEQICASLKRRYPSFPQMHLVHETIYRIHRSHGSAGVLL